ncbi:MAG: prephenate dehydrogenase [Chromatiales bacterium 21-64-14]|nr:MAG: prephenate dehydrogenase [Chromatiales bacterium 21-64-14]HQU15379.1 prephenate dehydrogenase/arogenate dehydrogenase family protein [Gammaproteobacteria bacterium]
MAFQRLCVIGVGLIGGSLARAARGAGVCAEVVGCGRSVANLDRALELGVIDRYEQDPVRAVAGADLVVLAVPLGGIGALLVQLAPRLAPDALVTDVGSTKGSVVAAARAALGAGCARFVPGHPIAGTEQSGVEASRADLFQDRCTILTPLAETAPHALAGIRGLWEAVGSRVVEMEPDHHDTVLAAVSHLPHLLAYGLVDWVVQRPDGVELLRYAGGGFRDFTRIASSDPVMWRDICAANRDAIVAALSGFHAHLGGLLDALRRGDGAQLEGLFRGAKAARDRWTTGGAASSGGGGPESP